MTTTNSLGRRAFLHRALSGIGACAGATALGGAGLLPRVARAGGPRVLILGDSMIAGALGLFLENGLRKEHGYEVLRYGKSSTGLARPDFFDWMKEARRQLEAFPDPDAVVAMFGGNDVQGLHMGKKGKGQTEWIVWQDPELFCESMSRPSGFRRTLLGVMSAFVGTEVRAVVMRIGGNRAQYRGGQDSHYIEVDGPDAWLIVHRDCCLSIAEKRRKA